MWIGLRSVILCPVVGFGLGSIELFVQLYVLWCVMYFEIKPYNIQLYFQSFVFAVSILLSF
jgi:hypothetical protein